MSPNVPSPRKSPEPAEIILLRDNLPREHGFEPLRVEGELPGDLRGTLFRNGPALFELFGRRYSHPFEGDGAVSAVRFDGGGVTGAVRVTENSQLQEERAAGRMLYGFSAPWPRRLKNAYHQRGKNTANTNVIAWQNRLFALMEGAKPIELSPGELATVGETDLDGVIKGAFSAHPHAVAATGALYNFGLRYGRDTYLDLYELPERGSARHLGAVKLPFAPMLHDFIATENHLVFFLSPTRIRVMRAMLQIGPFNKLVEWAPELGTEIIVVPIDRPRQPTRFRTDPFFQWHFSNAFEKDGRIVVDLVRYDDSASLDALGSTTGEFWIEPGRFFRATVDCEREAISWRQITDLGCEFPRLHPALEGADYRYAWLVSHDGHGLGRLDVGSGEVVSYELGDRDYASEPVFVPRGSDGVGNGETDGYVLSLIYDGARHESYVGVFAGDRLADGPVARAYFDHHIPITFHGNWVAG